MHIKIRLWVKVVFIIIIFVCLFFLYSRFIGIKGLKVKEYSIVDKNIPNNFYGLKIVQLNDIHYKVTTDKSDLEKIVKEINLLKPDIVIFGGDLFDSNIKYSDNDIKDLTKLLKSINSNIAKYAIKGEEDVDINSWETIMNDSNFININDDYEFIYSKGAEPILLVGISTNYYNNHIKETLEKIYSEINLKYNYSILVLHEPDFIDYIEYSKFNLILASHSHNGQIVLPFLSNVISDKYSNNYYNEFYELSNTKLYVSSGIGTSKYKLRFLNKPSINLYRLRNK